MRFIAKMNSVAIAKHNCLCALILAVLIATAADAQTTTAGQDPPNYRIRILAYFDSETLADFTRRVRGYVELRTSVGTGLPALKVTTDVAEIEQAENLLARKIREARETAKRGELFARPIEGQIKKMLAVEVDENTLASIKDDNPGEFSFKLNGAYPKHRPLSTVPPNLLQLLPELPDGVEYRFIGRHLILRDMQANIIIDEIPFAISCRDCRKWTADDEK